MKVNRYYSDQLRSVLYQLIDAGRVLQPENQAEFRELLQELGALADTVESFEDLYLSINNMLEKLTIKNVPQAEGVLAEMSAIGRKLSLIEGAMNEEIDDAKARAQQEGASLIARYNELEKAVKAFGTLNKSRLFFEKRSLELTFGTISFRQSTRITLQPRVTEEMVLQALRELGLSEGIRVKEELDRAAMSDWPDSKLETVGMKRRTVDTISVDVKSEALAV